MNGNCPTSVSDMQASMLLIVAGRLFAPPLSLSVHDVDDGEAMQVAGEKKGRKYLTMDTKTLDIQTPNLAL